VVQGVQLGHRATWSLGLVAGEPDRRQRQLLCLLPVQVAGARQVRRCVCSAHRAWPRMQIHAPAARVRRLPTPSKISSGHVLKFCPVASFSHSFFGESLGKGSELHFHCGILVRGIYVEPTDVLDLHGRVYPLPQVPKMDLGSVNYPRRSRHWVSTEQVQRQLFAALSFGVPWGAKVLNYRNPARAKEVPRFLMYCFTRSGSAKNPIQRRAVAKKEVHVRIRAYSDLPWVR
jgi:hypothetical protein